MNAESRLPGKAVLFAARSLLAHGRLALLLLTFPACPAHAQVLFEPGLGVLPGSQGWSYFALGVASQSSTPEGVLFDTSATTTTQAGFGYASSEPVNRHRGTALQFQLKMLSGTVSNTNRAGFSVIFLDQDRKGIELGFWPDRVFAQADSPLFVHAEETLFPMTNDLHSFSLGLYGSNYQLKASGHVLLQGPVRDYTAFSGPINPYRTPNIIFMGDDSASASASVLLGRVALVLPPRLKAISPAAISWTTIPGQECTVQESADLVAWRIAGRVRSASGDCSWTNTVVGPGSVFFRVECSNP